MIVLWMGGGCVDTSPITQTYLLLLTMVFNTSMYFCKIFVASFREEGGDLKTHSILISITYQKEGWGETDQGPSNLSPPPIPSCPTCINVLPQKFNEIHQTTLRLQQF